MKGQSCGERIAAAGDGHQFSGVFRVQKPKLAKVAPSNPEFGIGFGRQARVGLGDPDLH